MKIGIVGAGSIGGTLTRRLTALGHDVFVANSRGPEAPRIGTGQLSGPTARQFCQIGTGQLCWLSRKRGMFERVTVN
jgi:lactate dehydrogenase-like 2-hydroxyacid dehydrogenase